MNRKSIITHKDADQNLCTIAALMLEDAMQQLRMTREEEHPIPMTNGEDAPPGFAEDDGSKRTIFSADPQNVLENIEDTVFQYIPALDQQFEVFPTNRPATLCWWSLQNLIRFRLRQARQELADNCYPQSGEFKSDKQASRNPKKRPEASKFGRQPERE